MKWIAALSLVLVLALALPAWGADRESFKTSGQGYRFDENGWTYLHIEGQPRQRGYQHGYLLAPELEEIFKSLRYLTYWDTGKKWEFFVQAAERLYLDKIDPEFLEEIKGIAEGAQAAGVKTTWQEILAWNANMELVDYWWPNEKEGKYADEKGLQKEHCSAFIATGSYTSKGQVVMAHNSWDHFEDGQFFNLIMDLEPAKGQRIFMQSVPGNIYSLTDFFVTSAGLMGTETTIGGFGEYDPTQVPEFCRVRKAMQYAKDLDQFVEIIKKGNNGGYANSWLLADRRTGEIMRLELGLKYVGLDRTTDGYFIGFNSPSDPRIRNLECSNANYSNIKWPMGARRVRLTQLMREYKGRLDIEAARRIIADHYDVYLKKENPCSRTIEGRYDLDPMEYWYRPAYRPAGAVDGKVMDSDLAADLSFWARWGSSSGLAFDAQAFMAEHIQWEYLRGYLKDRPSQPWTFFQAGDK
ncbi:MAG: hypothetical protein JRC92_11170 [Deltaproteobacteria bacterium]|nr:hypothetical protein [Deltaproteobacteria bacterium]